MTRHAPLRATWSEGDKPVKVATTRLENGYVKVDWHTIPPHGTDLYALPPVAAHALPATPVVDQKAADVSAKPPPARYRWDQEPDDVAGIMVGPVPDGEWVRWADVQHLVGTAGTDRVGADGWRRLAEAQQVLLEAGRTIKDISERYGLQDEETDHG